MGFSARGSCRSALDAVRRLREDGCPNGRRRFHARVHFKPPGRAKRGRRSASSIFRAALPARWGRSAATTAEALPVVAERLFRKAGFDVVYPHQLAALCCGQAFESKGLNRGGRRKSAELEAALRDASENGRWPIVFDTSPCAHRMRQFCATRLPVFDSIEFIHDVVLPRLALAPLAEPVAIHPVAACARWVRSISSSRSRNAAVPKWSRSRRAVLRICRRQGLQPAGTQRIRAAPSQRGHSDRLQARLFVEPHLRNRDCPSSRAFRTIPSSIWSRHARAGEVSLNTLPSLRAQTVCVYRKPHPH